jgi:hypothetical protein
MNYFLEIKSKPNLPLIFSEENPVNGSFLAIGKFIADEIAVPLIYNDANNSAVDFDKLLTYDVLQTVGGGLLVSQRVFDAINTNFPNEVQFFSARFTYKNQQCNSYFVMNVYNKIACYDIERSHYTKHPFDQSYKFSKAVLQSTPIEEYGYEYHIVRSAENNKIVVSDKFKQLIEDIKINSIGLKK